MPTAMDARMKHLTHRHIIAPLALALTAACGGGDGQPATPADEPDTSQELEEAAEAVGEEVEGAAEDVEEAAEDAVDDDVDSPGDEE